MTLWKMFDGMDAVQIHDTNGNPIRIVVEIPRDLTIVPEGYTRTYRIIRVHDGIATVMAEGMNTELSISSELFSSYFIVYKDVKKDEKTNTSDTTAMTIQNVTENQSDFSAEAVKTSPKTEDSLPIAVLISIMISAIGVFVFCIFNKK